MTRMAFLQDLWATYMAQPPSRENSVRIRHLEMLMDEIQSPNDAQSIRKFIGVVAGQESVGGSCAGIVFNTAGGPFKFEVDGSPGVQHFLSQVMPTEGTIRKKWEVPEKLLLTVQQTRVCDAQWFVPWDGMVGAWKGAQTQRGKVFYYRVISHWLQLAEFVEYMETKRLIQDRFMVFNCITSASTLDDLAFFPAANDASAAPTWLGAARKAFHDKVVEKRIHHQYCSKQEAYEHINRIINQNPDGFSALNTVNGRTA